MAHQAFCGFLMELGGFRSAVPRKIIFEPRFIVGFKPLDAVGLVGRAFLGVNGDIGNKL